MKIPAWLTAQLATLVGVGVLAFLLVGQCNRARDLEQAIADAKAQVAKETEAHALDVAGIEQAHEATLAALQATLADYKARGDALANALAQAMKVAPNSTPIATASGSTGPVQVGGSGTALPPGPTIAAPVAAGGTALPPQPPPAVPACLLSVGDTGEIRTSGAALRTESGNVIIIAQAEAWRLNPDRPLFGGELHLKADYLKPPEPARGPGWGGGLAISGGRHGWTMGPVIASPPLTLWRLSFEPSAGISLGSSGEWLATAQMLARWR